MRPSTFASSVSRSRTSTYSAIWRPFFQRAAPSPLLPCSPGRAPVDRVTIAARMPCAACAIRSSRMGLLSFGPYLLPASARRLTRKGDEVLRGQRYFDLLYL